MNWHLRNHFPLFLSMCFCLGFLFHLRADLTPIYLKLELNGPRRAFTKDEVIPLTLTLKNTARKTHPVLWPGHMNQGQKMIYLSYYRVNGNIYTEIARDQRLIQMDTTRKGWIGVRNLKANNSLSFPIFINDSANYNQHIAAHFKLPNLPIGTYQVLAWYHPWDQKEAKYFFNPISDFLKYQSPIKNDTNKLDVPESGIISNYYQLTIAEKRPYIPPHEYTRRCLYQCELCHSVETNDWKSVERFIDRATFYNETTSDTIKSDEWFDFHRSVFWVYPLPEAILASLPTYTNRRIIFKNAQGFHHIDLTWQLGIVYPTRSRFKSMLSFLFDAPIKTSEVDYQKLIKFERH